MHRLSAENAGFWSLAGRPGLECVYWRTRGDLVWN
jgi:hypothetical protein